VKFFWESVVFKWIVAGVCLAIFVGAVFAGGTLAYDIVTTCWTCDVFGIIYDSLSKAAFQVFGYFQGRALLLLSIGLALWMVHETYKIFVAGMGENLEIKLDSEYFKKIYKKIFLATAIIGIFLTPYEGAARNVFANTFELVLDFGSGLGRQLLRGKISEMGAELPAECARSDSSLKYSEGMALSDTTRDNMVCLMREVDLVRRDYIELGHQLFEHGTKPIVMDIAVNITIRVSFSLFSLWLKKYGTDKWLKGKEGKITKQQGKIGDLERQIREATSRNENADVLRRQLERSQKTLDSLEDTVDTVKKDIADNAGRNVRGRQTIGRFMGKTNGLVANAVSVGHFIISEDFRMGVAGIIVLGGFFFVNLLFAFILIENLLFFGIAIVIFPFLAACFVFEATRSYATAAIRSQFKFAIGLIFMCLASVMCAEVNDWILGGMITAPAGTALSSPRYAIELLKAGDVDGYNAIVGTGWFFLFAFFAVMINGKLLMEAGTFAGWFEGSNIGGGLKSGLGGSLFGLGKSAVKTLTSVTRDKVRSATREDKKGKASVGDYLRYVGGKFKRKKE
jgi:cell division protein FtsL